MNSHVHLEGFYARVHLRVVWPRSVGSDGYSYRHGCDVWQIVLGDDELFLLPNTAAAVHRFHSSPAAPFLLHFMSPLALLIVRCYWFLRSVIRPFPFLVLLFINTLYFAHTVLRFTHCLIPSV